MKPKCGCVNAHTLLPYTLTCNLPVGRQVPCFRPRAEGLLRCLEPLENLLQCVRVMTSSVAAINTVQRLSAPAHGLLRAECVRVCSRAVSACHVSRGTLAAPLPQALHGRIQAAIQATASNTYVSVRSLQKSISTCCCLLVLVHVAPPFVRAWNEDPWPCLSKVIRIVWPHQPECNVKCQEYLR